MSFLFPRDIQRLSEPIILARYRAGWETWLRSAAMWRYPAMNASTVAVRVFPERSPVALEQHQESRRVLFRRRYRDSMCRVMDTALAVVSGHRHSKAPPAADCGLRPA